MRGAHHCSAPPPFSKMTYTYCVEWGVKLYYTNVGLIVIVLSGIIHGLYKLCLILFGSLSDFSRQCTYSCSSVRVREDALLDTVDLSAFGVRVCK